MTRPSVFITMHRDGLDVSDLDRFGVARIVMRKQIYPDEAQDGAEFVTRRAQEVLFGGRDPYRPDRDFIALVGDPLIIAIVVATAARHSRRLQLLKYDRENGAYYPVSIQIGDPHGCQDSVESQVIQAGPSPRAKDAGPAYARRRTVS